MFRTRQRDVTESIFVGYLNTPPDPRIDVKVIDEFDACHHHFGCTWHYLIKVDGTVEAGRDLLTIGAQPKRSGLKLRCISIGIVGGRDSETYELTDTITTEQEASLEALMQWLADTLQVSLEVEDRVTDRAARHKDKIRLREERRRLREAEEELDFMQAQQDQLEDT